MAERELTNDVLENDPDITIFNDWNKTRLKSFLKENNQLVSGSKKELIERARGVLVLKVTRVHGERTREEHCTTRTFPNGQPIPDPSTILNWSKDLSCVPDLTEKDVYNYFVLKMNVKRQLKSKVFFEDKHVHTLEYNNISNDCTHCFVRCKVIPLLPSSNVKQTPDHCVWALLSKVTGNILTAKCNCTAGIGEACNHVSALLYALVDVADKKNKGLLACTLVKCLWSNTRKRKLSPKKSSDMKFRKYSFGQSYNEEEKGKAGKEDQIVNKCSALNIDRFKNRLLSFGSNAGWLTNFAVEKIPEKEDIPVLHSINYMFHDSVDLNSIIVTEQMTNYFDSLCITESDCMKIEKLTMGQSKNENWQQCRNGRITSSNFGVVCKRRENTCPKSLLRRLLYEQPIETNKFLKWGKKHEPAARRMYAMKNPQYTVKESGLIVNMKYPHLGASPDGIVSMNGESGLLEIKCPAADKWKQLSPHNCAKDSDFYCFLDSTGNLKLKHTHNYYFQIQGQMAVCEKPWCDFVVWTLKKPFSVERIYFDEKFWSDCLKKLNHFYIHFMLPELFTRRIQRHKE